MSETAEGSEPSPLERETQVAESAFREREVAVKEAELALHRKEQAKSGWSSPLVVAVFAAAVGTAGNAVVTYVTGAQQRELEAQRSEQARLLEMLRTGNTETAAGNLRFLLDTGLLTEPHLVASISAFLAKRKPGTGPVLPVPGGNGVANKRAAVSDTERMGVQRAYTTVTQSLVLAQALLEQLAANSVQQQDRAQVMALKLQLQRDQARLTAGMGSWLNDATGATAPTDAVLSRLELLNTRLRTTSATDEAAVLEVVAQLQKVLDSVQLFSN